MLCGIDEAGRGCIAGDLVVAGVMFRDKKSVSGLNDSKKISEKKRNELFEPIREATLHHIVTISASQIDEDGISKSMSRALNEIMQNLNADEYLFDGNTTFGIKNLQTMVKADAKVLEVSAASILAKVTHDRNILKDAKEFPEYHFEKHKGYGTKLHIEMIKKYGYSKVHRKSYKIKALEKTLFE
jgi:ribonuclease HII